MLRALMHQRYHWSGTASPAWKLVPESATGVPRAGPGLKPPIVGGGRRRDRR